MTTKKYKLNVAQDVDPNEDGFFLYLPFGWRFDSEIVHCRNFDTMAELRAAARRDVIACDCAECAAELAKAAQSC
jgi:hypothetical protein